jgi:hypothetical protein
MLFPNSHSCWKAVETASGESFFSLNKPKSLLGQFATAVFSFCLCRRGDGGELELQLYALIWGGASLILSCCLMFKCGRFDKSTNVVSYTCVLTYCKTNRNVAGGIHMLLDSLRSIFFS